MILRSGTSVINIITRHRVCSIEIRDSIHQLKKEVAIQAYYRNAFTSTDIVNKPKPGKVAVIDFGDTVNITRFLIEAGCRVQVFPMNAFSEIKTWSPDGILLSDGPDNPNEDFHYWGGILDFVKSRKVPVFGIGLGHQIMALEAGFSVSRTDIKNRGTKQPVKNLITRQLKTVPQYHGFSVNGNGLSDAAEITHININDRAIEGLRFKRYTGFSFQYHPNLVKNKLDFLFNHFVDLIRILANRKKRRPVSSYKRLRVNH